jgi:hypothetical protein
MAANMKVNGQGYPFKPNQNKCSHCEQRNLPEPIVFAKLCRLTGEYVCDGCYGASMDVLIDMEQTRSRA